jgi:hypothetical protein
LRPVERLKIMRSERSQAGLLQQWYHQSDGIAPLYVDFSFGTAVAGDGEYGRLPAALCTPRPRAYKAEIGVSDAFGKRP